MPDIENDVGDYALHVDRGASVGNSPGTDLRYRLHVKVSNKVTEPIPVAVVDTVPGDPFFHEFVGPTTPGLPAVITSFVVPAGKSLFLTQFFLSLPQQAFFALIIGPGTPLGGGNTGPGHPSNEFSWNPSREVVAGETVSVYLDQKSDTPSDDIQVYIQGILQ